MHIYLAAIELVVVLFFAPELSALMKTKQGKLVIFKVCSEVFLLQIDDLPKESVTYAFRFDPY
jgi:hypothetical protein